MRSSAGSSSSALRMLLLAALIPLALAGCAHQGLSLPPYQEGMQVQSISSAVSLSVTTPAGGSSGGSGHLLYQRPDSFRLVMLTPFGTVALDSYVVNSRITLLVPSKNLAYAGTVDELPEHAGMDAWRILRWVLDGDPFRIRSGPTLEEREDPILGKTAIRYDADGLLTGKDTADGYRADYGNYLLADGIPFPSRIAITDRHGGRVTVDFDEPELNRSLEEDAFTPRVQGLTPLPLTEFKEE